MSVFSRFFGKNPSPSSTPAPASQRAPSAQADALSKQKAADRASVASADERALKSAIDSADLQALGRLTIEGATTRIRQAAAEAIDDPEVLRQLIREVRGGKDGSVYRILTAKRDAHLAQARQTEQLQAELSAAAEALERLSRRPYDSLSASKLEQVENRWNAVAAHADAGLSEKARQWITLSRETIAEPMRLKAAQAAQEQAAAAAAAEARRLQDEQAQRSAAEAAEQAAARAAVLEERHRERAEKQDAEQQAIREIGELVRRAQGALSGGSTSRAAGLRRTIEEKRAGAPPLPAGMASQIQQLDQQLNELKDWKSFSVAPKRTELIEEMELLIGVALEPPALAERIKSLQDEWRTLSKGAGESFEAEWQRFQAASQKAYEPCSEYFAAQAAIRAENLQHREGLIARLTAFEAETNWEQPDWRAVIKVLRETKQEWRSHSTVDWQVGKPQQERFQAVTASLQGRLDAEYARNLEQKQSLIERARQALENGDSRKSIDAIKALQQQWRTVGPLPREQDQRLWEEFRQHCDAVFQKRQQDVDAVAAGLEHNKAQAVALCEQVETIAALEGAELLTASAALKDLRTSFQSIGELPRADTRELRNRFDRALDRCESSIARERARDAERAWTDLFDAADRVRAYELAVARGSDPERVRTSKEAAEAHLASVPRWPKNGLEVVRQRLASERPADLAANEVAYRTLCIRAEILTDLPTPAEDQPLRRDYQLKRLVQNMGQGSQSGDTQLDDLAIEWVGIGPVDDATYEPLLQRFQQCRDTGTARVASRSTRTS